VTSDALRDTLGSFANTVTVVATAHQGQRFGFMSTAVSTVDFDTPTLLITVNRNASSHDPIAASRCFSVNILAEDQEDISVRFTGFRGHKGEARFEGADWSVLETGAPVLQGAVASLDCRVTQSLVFGKQTLFFGQIVAAAQRPEPKRPLVYFGRGYAVVRPLAGWG
jgi:flavin reductase (DIM6/NTAB) family NADH-FMN oxidoreductase RutF